MSAKHLNKEAKLLLKVSLRICYFKTFYCKFSTGTIRKKAKSALKTKQVKET